MKKAFVFVLLVSQAAWAGNGWVSSGGEFRKDQHNPWFLKNTQSVYWCLKHSNEFVSLSSSRSKELIELGILYWKSQFSTLDQSTGIGQQNFVYNSECTGQEALKFKIGHDTLDAEETAYIANKETPLAQHAGLTIRKFYDTKNLQGSGIIYIASDLGPQRFESGRGVPQSFWQNEGLFLRVLVHELGHFFGLPHEAGGFMAEAYPEEIIRMSREQQFEDTRRIDNLPQFFLIPQKQKLCQRDYNSIVPGIFDSCFELEWNQEKLKLSSQSSTLENPLIEGSVMVSLDFPLKIFLPKGQEVFRGYPENSFVRGPARAATHITTRIEKMKSNLSLHLHPNKMEIIVMTEKSVKNEALRVKGKAE